MEETEMSYDQEPQAIQKIHLNFDLEFHDDPLDEGDFYSIIEKDH